MAPRPYWKGYLKLSLVSCPIALHTGDQRRRAHRVPPDQQADRQPVAPATCRRSHPRAGRERRQGARLRIRQGRVHPGRGRGARRDRDREQPHDRDRHVRAARADRRALFRRSYYVTPNDEVGQDAFVVIRDAMRGKEMVALGRVVLAKRERVIMLQPWDKGLMGTTLALRLRGAQREGLFRRDRRHQGVGRDAQAGRAHPRHQEGRLRSGDVRRPLRGSAW